MDTGCATHFAYLGNTRTAMWAPLWHSAWQHPLSIRCPSTRLFPDKPLTSRDHRADCNIWSIPNQQIIGLGQKSSFLDQSRIWCSFIKHVLLSLLSKIKENIRLLTENIPNWWYYPQLEILSPIGNIRSPTGDNIQVGDWGFLKPGNWARKWIPNPQLGKKYPIGGFELSNCG